MIDSAVMAAIDSARTVTIESDVMATMVDGNVLSMADLEPKTVEVFVMGDGGAGGGGFGVRSRGSDDGWTEVNSEATKGIECSKDQGEEGSGSALMARIVFDKDNPAGRQNTAHSVVIM